MLNGIPMTLASSYGTLSSPVATINGCATSTFKSGTKAGTAAIYTKLDNETVKTLVTIKDPITLKVTSTIPSNNSHRVSLTSPITIKFNENIAAGAYYSKIYIKNLSTGKIVTITRWISGNTLTIKMTKKRMHGNTYEVYIPKAAVKDRTGNNLAAAYTFKFQTG